MEKRACKLDLIDSVDMLMQKFGFRIRKKIANQFCWQVVVITGLAFVDIIQAMVSFIPVENNERLMEILSDAGYGGFGPKHRNILNMMYGTFRLNLVILQVNFVMDKMDWLVKANVEFKKIQCVTITESTMNKKIAKAKFFVRLATFFMLFITMGQMSFTTYLIHKKDDHLDWVIFNKFIYFFFSQILQNTHSGAYLAQYYLLTELSLNFIDQYNQHLEVLLKEKKFICSKQLINEFKRFSNLYLMIQYLKESLKRTYLIFIVCMFVVSIQNYYSAFYTDVHIFGRVALFIMFIGCLCVIVIFSSSADKINTKCRQMADRIYGVFNNSLDQKFSNQLNFEVRKFLTYIAAREHFLCRSFGTLKRWRAVQSVWR